jgi:glycosyltransferase involved in cell wall biosynthesis
MWTEESPDLSNVMSGAQPLPRVTIVTPSYNQGRFIEATIRSVLLQGYPNLEYIIIDGGSSDNSVEIIRKYEPWLAYWVSQKDRGQAHAINKGFARATGVIFAYLNSDDYYEPGALHRCAMAFSGGHQWVVGRVQCWQEGVGYGPFPELPGKNFTRWFLSCPIAQAGCFWSAKLHREVGPFDENLDYSIDYEFWLRFRFIKKIKPLIIEQPIAVYRLHPRSKTVAHNTAFAPEIKNVVERYKRLLTRRQRWWLWVAGRHRKARIRGAKAVSLLKKRQLRAAIRQLLAALADWPFMAVDLHGGLLAIRELVSRNKGEPVFPEIWPD